MLVTAAREVSLEEMPLPYLVLEVLKAVTATTA